MKFLDWSVASRPLAGTTRGGDVHVLVEHEAGALVAVIDGLGHGEEAAVAAAKAAAVLRENSSEPVIALVRRCHKELHATRGVVMSVASLDARHDLVTWLAVGNVAGLLIRREAATGTASLLLRSGVVGVVVPTLHAEVLPVSPGDTLIFATDGIDPAFAQGVARSDPVERISARILERYGRKPDDALVLVARYLRGAP